MKQYKIIILLCFAWISAFADQEEEALSLAQIGRYFKAVHVDGEAHFIISDDSTYLHLSPEGNSEMVRGGQAIKIDSNGELVLVARHTSLTLKAMPKLNDTLRYEATMLIDKRSFGGELIKKSAIIVAGQNYGSLGYGILPQDASHDAGATNAPRSGEGSLPASTSTHVPPASDSGAVRDIPVSPVRSPRAAIILICAILLVLIVYIGWRRSRGR